MFFKRGVVFVLFTAILLFVGLYFMGMLHVDEDKVKIDNAQSREIEERINASKLAEEKIKEGIKELKSKELKQKKSKLKKVKLKRLKLKELKQKKSKLKKAKLKKIKLKELKQKKSSLKKSELKKYEPTEVHAEGSKVEGHEIKSDSEGYGLKDWSFGVSAGSNVFGHLKRYGHSIDQKNSIFLKVGADKRISDEYSFGFSAMYQNGGKVKDNYKVGIISHAVQMKYKTAAILANAKYFFETAGEINPYATGSLGISINQAQDEVHVANGVVSTFHKKGAYIQPSAGIGFGVNYSIYNAQKIFMEYQVLYSGKMKTKALVTTGSIIENKSVSSNLFQNIITVGLEFKI